MCTKVLACPQTTLYFMRNLGLQADQSIRPTDRPADRSQAEILQLIENRSIKLYTPPHVLAFLHAYLRDQEDDSISSEGMKRLLRISCSNLSVDYDVLLDESLNLAAGHDEFDVCETLCLLIAKSLNVDFFVVQNPDYFARMSQHQIEQQSGRNILIVSIEELLGQFRI
jgi:hypothetical protein